MARRSQSSLTHWASRGMGDLMEYGDDYPCYCDAACAEFNDCCENCAAASGGGMFFYAPLYGSGSSLPPPPDPGVGFWDWFYGGMPGDPPLPPFNPPPIDFELPSFAGPTHVAVCGKGTYVDPNDVTRCIPFPPAATEAQKKALQQQGQQAAQRAQQAQRQQQQLQQAAQQCAAKGGRLVQTQTGYACQLPNGQLENVNLGGIPSWIWLALLGVVVLSSR